MKIIFVLFLIFLSSCTTLKGTAELSETQIESLKSQEEQIKENLSATVEDLGKSANMSLKDSIDLAFNSLNNLQVQLNILGTNIDQINRNIDEAKANSQDPLMRSYLDDVKVLTGSSKEFTESLIRASNSWQNYLESANINVSNKTIEADDESFANSLQNLIESMKGFLENNN